MLMSFEAIQICHVPTEGNKEADDLAGREREGFVIGAISILKPQFQSVRNSMMSYTSSRWGSVLTTSLGLNEGDSYERQLGFGSSTTIFIAREETSCLGGFLFLVRLRPSYVVVMMACAVGISHKKLQVGRYFKLGLYGQVFIEMCNIGAKHARCSSRLE